ncbi:hypothetical protein Tco_0656818 [Tanacetum coccineum]|uniref:Uncharacterized protein n=1 Tax=Tanacetum coccineum TaxID=301880 RepID=A0ABQ4X9U0_9ASTR
MADDVKTDIRNNFEIIPKGLEKDFHSIKDDTLLVSVYATGKVTVRGMLISDDLLTDEIQDTQAYKYYKEELKGKKKEKRVAKEISSPRPSLKVRIWQQQPSTTNTPPSSDDRERDEIHEATQLSLTLHKTAKAAKEQENVTAVEKKILEEDVEKLVEREDDDSNATDFDDSVFLKGEKDFGTRIELGSHKDKPEKIDDDDEEKKDDKKNDDDDNDDDDHTHHALIKTEVMGSLEIRNEKMQTPIPSHPRSLRKDLSLDKAIVEELTGIMEKVDVVLYDIVPKISPNATNDLIDDNLPRIKMKSDLQAQVDDLELWDELRAKGMMLLLRGEKGEKAKDDKNLKDAWVDTPVVDEDKVIPEDETPELINEFYNVDKRRNLNEPPRYLYNKDLFILKNGNTEENRSIIEELEIIKKNISSITRLSKLSESLLNNNTGFMEQIIMMRENDKLDSFSEANFMYLNKNDIEEMYYLCLNKKVNYHKNKLLKMYETEITKRLRHREQMRKGESFVNRRQNLQTMMHQ